MISPAPFNAETTPSVAICGVKYPVPELAPRQLRHIRAALLELNRRLGVANGDRPAGVDVFVSLSDEDYDRLLLDPVYWALTRAHPDLKKDEFIDLPWADTELIAAWFVVRRQSGLFMFEGEGGASPGEAQAGEEPGPDPDWDELIAHACRYFGSNPDYWEDALTMRRISAHGRVLARDPPPEFFLASYFIGHGWWNPAGKKDEAEAAIPESTLPEFEP